MGDREGRHCRWIYEIYVAWLGRGGEKDGAEEEGTGKVTWLDPDP